MFFPWRTLQLGTKIRTTTKMQYFEPNVETKSAIFAQGCFWGPDCIYGALPGVIRTRVGYTGGTLENPTYHNLGDHTEAFAVEFDPQVTNYSNFLSVFWKNHDPTILNKPQYKSAIYYSDNEQKLLAEETLKNEQKRYSAKIATEILQAGKFYNAEDYHQKYVLRSNRNFFKSLGLDDEALLKCHVATRLNGFLGGFGSLKEFEEESAKWGLTQDQLDVVRQTVKKGVKIVCH